MVSGKKQENIKVAKEKGIKPDKKWAPKYSIIIPIYGIKEAVIFPKIIMIPITKPRTVEGKTSVTYGNRCPEM